MQKEKFIIYGWDGHFNGIHENSVRWNGWCNPYFKLNEAKKVLAIQESKEQCKEDGVYYYEFTEDFEAIKCITDEGEFIENSVIIDGQKYFAIGFYNWCWEKKR